MIATRKTASHAQRGGGEDFVAAVRSREGSGSGAGALGGDADCEGSLWDFRDAFLARLVLRFFFAMAPRP